MAKRRWGFTDNQIKYGLYGNHLRGGCNGSRIAGDGIISDDYSEESGNKPNEFRRPLVKFPSDRVAPETMNGPVIVVQKGRKKDGK